MKRLFLKLLLPLCCGVLLSCGTGGTGGTDSAESAKPKGKLNAGVVQADITPAIGYKVHKVPSDGIFDPLEVKTIVLKQDDCQAAIVVADLFFMPQDLSETVRKMASEKTGIPVSNICVAATHTHADPTCYDEIKAYVQKLNSGNLSASDKESYAALLIDKMVKSVIDAQSGLQPVNLKSGMINIEGISFNRRHLMKDGQVIMNGGFLNPDIVRAVGPVDPGLGVVLFNSESGNNTVASFSTFAMQLATIGDNNTKYSSGFPHFMEKKLQNQFGDNFISVFGEGPSADVNHWDITKPGPQVGYEESTRPVGQKIGETMLQNMSLLKEGDGSLAVISKTINVPLQTYNNMDLQWAKSFSDAGASPILKARVRKILLLEKLRGKYGETLPMEIQAIRFNDHAAVVALPGQLFVELGLAIKNASPFESTIVLTVANSHEDCIPIRKAFPEGSYEIIYSLVESGGGEMMAETAVSLLNELKNK